MSTAAEKLREGTYNPNEGQALWWSLYDTAVFDSAQVNPLQYVYYTDRLGQNGKTLADTNARGAGQIPTGNKFESNAIEMYYIPNAAKLATEVQNILDAFSTGFLVFDITSKSNQLELPLSQLMGNPFPMVLNQADNQLQSRSSYTGIWETPIPLILAAQVSFSASLNFTVAPNASLDGDKFFMSLVGSLVTLQ